METQVEEVKTNTNTEEQTSEIKDPKAVLEALSKANAEAKKYRELSEAQATEIATHLEKITSLEGDEGIALWKKRAIDVSAKAALATAGVKDPDRVLGLMNVADISMDEAGVLTGFNESLEATKTKLPELFDDKRRVGGQANLHDQGNVKEQKSVTEMQVDSLFNH